MIELPRRSFLVGLAAAFTAPAIVRADSLMPVKFVDWHDTRILYAYLIGSDEMAIRVDRAPHRMVRPVRDSSVVEILTPTQARQMLNRSQRLAFNAFLKTQPECQQFATFAGLRTSNMFS